MLQTVVHVSNYFRLIATQKSFFKGLLRFNHDLSVKTLRPTCKPRVELLKRVVYAKRIDRFGNQA